MEAKGGHENTDNGVVLGGHDALVEGAGVEASGGQGGAMVVQDGAVVEASGGHGGAEVDGAMVEASGGLEGAVVDGTVVEGSGGQGGAVMDGAVGEANGGQGGAGADVMEGTVMEAKLSGGQDGAAEMESTVVEASGEQGGAVVYGAVVEASGGHGGAVVEGALVGGGLKETEEIGGWVPFQGWRGMLGVDGGEGKCSDDAEHNDIVIMVEDDDEQWWWWRMLTNFALAMGETGARGEPEQEALIDTRSCMELNFQTEWDCTWMDSLDHDGLDWFEQLWRQRPLRSSESTSPLLLALQNLALALAMEEDGVGGALARLAFSGGERATIFPEKEGKKRERRK